MKWLKALAITLVALVAAAVIVRELAPLPPLEPRTQTRAILDTDDTLLGNAIAPLASERPGLTGIYTLRSGVGAFATRVLLARAAQRSIDAQYYLWHDDLTGRLLFNELLRAADRGVRVRLLLDDNNTSGLDRIVAALDSHPNIDVRLFNPFTIRKPRMLGYLTDFSRLNRRMHNKSFTVDSQATVVGGRNIGDEYFDASQEGALFVDLDVLAVGEVVPEVSADFDRYWASGSSYPAERIVPHVNAEGLKAVMAGLSRPRQDAAWRTYVDAIRAHPVVDELLGGRLRLEWAPVRMVSDDPAKGLRRVKQEKLLFSQLREVMGRPRETLGLVSGYFVPAEKGTEALADMARRGVAVTVLTNAFEATDVPIVHAGYAKRRKDLLRAGVGIFELRGSEAAARPRRSIAGSGSGGSRLSGTASALHAKTFMMDDERLFVGSFNFDPRSVRLNTELGFVIDSQSMAKQMHDALRRLAPQRSYEVRLSQQGELVWIERVNGREVMHDTEPGTTGWQRAAIGLLSLLPIEWML